MKLGRMSTRLWASSLIAAPAVALCALAQLEIWTAEPPPAGSTWLHAVLAAVTTIALAGRRWLPVASLAVVVVSNAGEVVLTSGGAPFASFLAVCLAVFAVSRHCSLRRALGGAALAVAASTARDVADPGINELDIALSWLLLVLIWSAGFALQRRHRSERSLQQEAERLRRERDEQIRAAAAAERRRLSRELHDIVAHNISVVAVQAGAARWVLQGDENGQVRDALVTIERTSREALAELRRLLEVLRGDEEVAEHTPQRGLADVPDLIRRVRAAGQPLELHLDGTAEPLPPGVDLAAYRVVQEALTNVLKHAPGAPAAVAVRRLQSAVEVEVTNGQPVARRSALTPQCSGHGLVGMRERVALYGGDLTAAPDGPHAFSVRARLPLQAEP